MVGQNLGAKKPDRAEKSVYVAAVYNMVFLGLVGVVFVVFAGPLIRLFTSDPAVLPVGTECLRIVSYGFLFYAFGMVMTQAFNGAGDTWTPTRINFFIFWLFEIPLAWFLSRRTGMGPAGSLRGDRDRVLQPRGRQPARLPPRQVEGKKGLAEHSALPVISR